MADGLGRDAQGVSYGSYPAERAKHYQKVLNQSWPLRHPDGSSHARGIDTRPAIDVTVRLVLERDGETFLDGQADRWTKTHVHVSLSDPRLQVNGAWVLAEDVKRR